MYGLMSNGSLNLVLSARSAVLGAAQRPKGPGPVEVREQRARPIGPRAGKVRELAGKHRGEPSQLRLALPKTSSPNPSGSGPLCCVTEALHGPGRR